MDDPEFVIPATPQEIGDPPQSGYLDWAKSFGGIDSTSTTVTFSVTSDSTIVLEGLEVRVVERKPALVGSFVKFLGLFPPLPHSGRLWYSVYQVDLDDEELTTVRTDHGEGDWDFPISIGQSDTYIAQVTGAAEDTDTSWEIDIHYVSKGERRTAIVDDNGKPFRTTGSKSAAHHWEIDEWVDGPPQ